MRSDSTRVGNSWVGSNNFRFDSTRLESWIFDSWAPLGSTQNQYYQTFSRQECQIFDKKLTFWNAKSQFGPKCTLKATFLEHHASPTVNKSSQKYSKFSRSLWEKYKFCPENAKEMSKMSNLLKKCQLLGKMPTFGKNANPIPGVPIKVEHFPWGKKWLKKWLLKCWESATRLFGPWKASKWHWSAKFGDTDKPNKNNSTLVFAFRLSKDRDRSFNSS